MTIAAYLKIKDTLTNTTRRLYRGKWEALHNGKWISESAFRAIYQLPTVLNGCKENPDKRKLYLLS
jgi:hypothetical protein